MSTGANGKKLMMVSNVFIEPSGPFMRCPSCGAMVRMPCMSCYHTYGAYPDSVLLAYLNVGSVPKKRKCVKCGKTKPISKFGKESDSFVEVRYSTCRDCRTEIEAKRNGVMHLRESRLD